MRNHTTAFFAFSLIAMSAAANAVVPASEVRFADQNVAHQARITRQAEQSGDVATIAVERAKLQAARAAAWEKRHPVQPPANTVAVK
ncbi:MAG: hypothetical protein JWO15_1560 [Sphingomonadales bacterium]|nr:hypothetical protein [Sphingomonadales bacterium]